MRITEPPRKSGQFPLPGVLKEQAEGYNIYPAFHLPGGKICCGYESLAEVFSHHDTVVIEGYAGVFFDDFIKRCTIALSSVGKKSSWKKASDFLKPSSEIDQMVAPFLGGDDPLFGRRTDLSIEDFLDVKSIRKLQPDTAADINFIIGPGASLSGWRGLLVYIDLPKNEIQYRARAGSITNLGATGTTDPKEMYKRFYFVEWEVLNRLKERLTCIIDIFIDGQNVSSPAWTDGRTLLGALHEMSRNYFPARPWFEPGAWGGSWIKEHIRGVNHDEPNYAWSFELISPENGLLLESSGILLEFSFDMLMYAEAESVLGVSYARFRNRFPIRFDFLDTFDGGNLSIQCHPRQIYMKDNFGEDFTQEESYYILDTKDDAVVYLGLTEAAEQTELQLVLEESCRDAAPVEIDRYVQKHRASKHNLFLIPPGTIHGSGKNNLVLEISSTPYIFTFKMYDWLRPDLDGKPRTLNIRRGLENLRFDRKGSYVTENLVSHPVLLQKKPGWELWQLPTHEDQLYNVRRYHIRGSVDIFTENKCHVLNLVEGNSVAVTTLYGFKTEVHYAETFVIPAAAISYTITSRSGAEAILVLAYVK